ncbi:unnamed protein product [Chondrus crispus]|uniref:Uncharacterized protein n=1 Tax=Chondrus crispus TaxID=2769 RepID=R7QM35_CHOCR|nr:unnamed protein product [Chondrus crispus]CDF38843.1 unnamed protein product [Chondrus crispus]|eukprot:XP_005718748.1 unnamed protein product [Chondrus crispus]
MDNSTWFTVNQEPFALRTLLSYGTGVMLCDNSACLH